MQPDASHFRSGGKDVGGVLRALILGSAALFAPALAAETLPVMYVRCIVASDRPAVLQAATRAQCQKEVEILNRYFRKKDRSRIIHFKFGGFTDYQRAARSSCEVTKVLGRNYNPFKDFRPFLKQYRSCRDAEVRDPRAINLFITDSTSDRGGYKENSSNGGIAGGLPVVVLDYARLNHVAQSPEEHEMGHAFGLGHVCHPGAKRGTSTNIMASHLRCNGKGGLRDLGFEGWQLLKIERRLRQFQERMFGSNPPTTTSTGPQPPPEEPGPPTDEPAPPSPDVDPPKGDVPPGPKPQPAPTRPEPTKESGAPIRMGDQVTCTGGIRGRVLRTLGAGRHAKLLVETSNPRGRQIVRAATCGRH